MKYCIKDTCQRCDIGYIIKDYIKPLMQAITIDLTEYNMRLITSKCLNTAVSFMFLFFGKNALKDTVYCDVDNVVERHNSNIDNSNVLMSHLKKDIIRKTKSRYVYYIMLTDGYMTKPDGSQVFFPGHVMVWEKIPWGKENIYYIYQSYIDQYDFNSSFQFRPSLKLSMEKMKYYLESIEKMIQYKVWDRDMITFWRDLTNVDTSRYLDAKASNGTFYLCFRRKRSLNCMKNILTYVKDTLKKIPSVRKGLEQSIYGDINRYDENSSPLTNEKMRNALKELEKRLENNIVEK